MSGHRQVIPWVSTSTGWVGPHSWLASTLEWTCRAVACWAVSGCLFCGRSDGGFVSAEHVIPESLGNREWTLPAGVVCDRCNSGRLAVLDQALCDYFPIKMRRTMLGVRSKQGKVPDTRFVTGQLRSSGPDGLLIETHSASDTTTFREVSRDGDTVNLRLEAKGGRPLTPKVCAEIRAALLKMAVEFLWLTDPDLAAGPAMAHARQIVMGAKADGFVLAGRQGDPDHREVSVTHSAVDLGGGRHRLWVHAKVYGVLLATDSRLTEPLENLTDEFNVWPISAADL